MILFKWFCWRSWNIIWSQCAVEFRFNLITLIKSCKNSSKISLITNGTVVGKTQLTLDYFAWQDRRRILFEQPDVRWINVIETDGVNTNTRRHLVRVNQVTMQWNSQYSKILIINMKNTYVFLLQKQENQ